MVAGVAAWVIPSGMRWSVLAFDLSIAVFPHPTNAQNARMDFNSLVAISVAEERPYTLAHEIIIRGQEPIVAITGAVGGASMDGDADIRKGCGGNQV